MEVVTTQTEEEYVKRFKTNLFIAIFTTAYARFKLYEALETLQEWVLCYDTELDIHKWRPVQTVIPLGAF